jgi:hypothetical protein
MLNICQHLTKDVPMLAPLFDKMTTRNVPSRFTAAEALQFLEKLVIRTYGVTAR